MLNCENKKFEISENFKQNLEFITNEFIRLKEGGNVNALQSFQYDVLTRGGYSYSLTLAGIIEKLKVLTSDKFDVLLYDDFIENIMQIASEFDEYSSDIVFDEVKNGFVIRCAFKNDLDFIVNSVGYRCAGNKLMSPNFAILKHMFLRFFATVQSSKTLQSTIKKDNAPFLGLQINENTLFSFFINPSKRALIFDESINNKSKVIDENTSDASIEKKRKFTVLEYIAYVFSEANEALAKRPLTFQTIERKKGNVLVNKELLSVISFYKDIANTSSFIANAFLKMDGDFSLELNKLLVCDEHDAMSYEIPLENYKTYRLKKALKKRHKISSRLSETQRHHVKLRYLKLAILTHDDEVIDDFKDIVFKFDAKVKNSIVGFFNFFVPSINKSQAVNIKHAQKNIEELSVLSQSFNRFVKRVFLDEKMNDLVLLSFKDYIVDKLSVVFAAIFASTIAFKKNGSHYFDAELFDLLLDKLDALNYLRNRALMTTNDTFAIYSDDVVQYLFVVHAELHLRKSGKSILIDINNTINTQVFTKPFNVYYDEDVEDGLSFAKNPLSIVINAVFVAHAMHVFSSLKEGFDKLLVFKNAQDDSEGVYASLRILKTNSITCKQTEEVVVGRDDELAYFPAKDYALPIDEMASIIFTHPLVAHFREKFINMLKLSEKSFDIFSEVMLNSHADYDVKEDGGNFMHIINVMSAVCLFSIKAKTDNIKKLKSMLFKAYVYSLAKSSLMSSNIDNTDVNILKEDAGSIYASRHKSTLAHLLLNDLIIQTSAHQNVTDDTFVISLETPQDAFYYLSMFVDVLTRYNKEELFYEDAFCKLLINNVIYGEAINKSHYHTCTSFDIKKAFLNDMLTYKQSNIQSSSIKHIASISCINDINKHSGEGLLELNELFFQIFSKNELSKEEKQHIAKLLSKNPLLLMYKFAFTDKIIKLIEDDEIVIKEETLKECIAKLTTLNFKKSVNSTYTRSIYRVKSSLDIKELNEIEVKLNTSFLIKIAKNNPAFNGFLLELLSGEHKELLLDNKENELNYEYSSKCVKESVNISALPI